MSYHMTVPQGKFGAAVLSMREAFLRRFYPEIGDHDWRAQSRQIASATKFADYQKKRHLDLINAEEEEEQSILCPY